MARTCLVLLSVSRTLSGAAAHAGIDPETVADEERRKPMFAGLLDYLASADPGFVATAPVSLPNDEPPSETVRAFIRDAIREVAERGNAVIAAHAGSYAVGAGPDALRILITAPRETRSKPLRSGKRANRRRSRPNDQTLRRRTGRLPQALLRRRTRTANPLRPRDQHRHALEHRSVGIDRAGSGRPPKPEAVSVISPNARAGELCLSRARRCRGSLRGSP
ncbi:MAG: cytidylate kinase-like family protein [Actinobacteria bacterium]|nr:MAG: cytidylate kinase-like family protein [Actinomycetota bacterium]